MCTFEGRRCCISHCSAGVVIAYISTANARAAVSETPETVDRSFEDIQTYLATLQRVSSALSMILSHGRKRKHIVYVCAICFVC